MKIKRNAGLVLLLFFFATASYAQKTSVYHRVVVDDRARPLDYFNVIIRNPKDSTEVRGETFLHGNLELRNCPQGHRMVKIQSLGYEDLEYAEDFSTSTDADTLVMQIAATKLDAVVVNGRIPQVTTSRGKTLVRVDGSSLAHMPEVTDILRRAPGMKVDEDGISIFGKGKPQIFIDGRESTYEELKLLQPQQIASIEVDNSPSARYDASYAAVVRVKTVRAKGGVSGQIANHSYFGRRYSNSSAAQLQIASKRWVNYFSYQYSDRTQQNYVTGMEAIHLSASPITDTVFSAPRYRSHSHSVLYGSTFDISPRHQLLWQYDGTFSKGISSDRQHELSSKSGEMQNINSHVAGRSSSESHSADLRYRFTADSVHTFEITIDYAHSSPRSKSTTERHYEESESDDVVAISNHSMADVFAAKAEYDTPLWGTDLLMGLHYGYINNRTTSLYNDNETLTHILSNNFAVYATIGKDYTKWGWSAGLRGEFLNDNIQANGVTLRKGWQKNLFPSMSIYTSKLSRVIGLSFSYSTHVSHPVLSELDPAAHYVNSVVTSYGNPLLLTMFRDNLEFGISLWKQLSFRFLASYATNATIKTGELNETGDAISFKPISIPHTRSYVVLVTYNNSWGPISLTLEGGIEFPRTKVPYLGEMRTYTDPSWYVAVNTDIKLAKNTSFTAGFDYTGKSYYLISTMEPKNHLNIGITQYLFDRRLQLSLFGDDLLRGNFPGRHDRYGFYETSQHSSFDTRQVRFSVRWLFNNHKKRYTERAGSDEYNRLN